MFTTEQELVKRSQQGDVDAFEHLISIHQQKVYNIAYRLLGNAEDAADLAQEALVKAFKSMRNFRGEASFSTWLYHIVVNVCRDELRKKSRNRTVSLDEPVNLEDGENLHREVADWSQTPEHMYEQKELGEWLQHLINSLKPDYRLIVIMREMQGLTYEEIAESLHISVGTVKSRLNRARSYLKDMVIACREPSGHKKRLIGEGREA